MHTQVQHEQHASPSERGRYSQGAEVIGSGVRYRTWTEHDRADVVVLDHEGSVLRELPMHQEDDGYFVAIDPEGKAGDLYRYRLAGADHWPDPFSRYQPFGVHGASMVVDWAAFNWTDAGWQRPAFDDLIIYELHVGTFTPTGTFRSAIDKLNHTAALGANAIEIMPIADFPGDRNWGYDGVMLYAPARAYGTPDDLRALIDAAHRAGLAVILDVVYNHLGPDGNYVGLFHRGYFNPEHKTPWGDAFDLDRPAVRDLFAENAPYWMREFHVDGFRLDATHAILDRAQPHILAEIAERVHELGGFVIAEDERNEPSLLRPIAAGGMGIDGCWADDFHHIVRVALTGERDGYYRHFSGTPAELADTIEHGWLYRGQMENAEGELRGGDSAGLAPSQFVYCISNHDQVGNRAFGERLSHITSEASYRAASALLCLVPQTPMLFMGQEWAASTPFQYFTDHSDELGRSVTKGRRQEFRDFAAFANPESLKRIPDPQANDTFENSKLRWDETRQPRHAALLELYRAFLSFRRTHPAMQRGSRTQFRVLELEHGIVAIHFGAGSDCQCLVLCDLAGGHDYPEAGMAELPGKWRQVLSSNDERFGGDDAPPFSIPTTIVFDRAP